MRKCLAVMLLALCVPLTAQEDEQHTDLAVAFPSTTLVYGSADVGGYLEALNPSELFAGLDVGTRLPDLGDFLRDRIELTMTDAEFEALQGGVNRAALGLLDIAVAGPRLQLVIEHKDLSALARALKQAHADGVLSMIDMEDYYGVPIYEIEAPRGSRDTEADPFGMASPEQALADWAAVAHVWVAIHGDKHLVIATSQSAVKDAVDYLSYPEDPLDTLLGNSRYKEAMAEFKDPQAQLFINVQSVINTVERLAGDGGSSGPLQDIVRAMVGVGNEEVQFYIGLIQYEQFKSFAAAGWIDEQALTLRIDARFVFHNPPGWLDALRVEARPMPFTKLIPADSTFAMTTSIDDAPTLYGTIKEFLKSRAATAGHTDVIDALEEAEEMLQGEDALLGQLLGHMGVGQAFVVLPPHADSGREPPSAAILGLKDRKAAELFLYEKCMDSPIGSLFREAESGLSSVTFLHGVEIHHDPANTFAFAFMDLDGDAGALVMGTYTAVERIIKASFEDGGMAHMGTWNRVHPLMAKVAGPHMYINFGAIMKMVATFTTMIRFWDVEAKPVDRDDTEKDDDPMPHLADFFGETVIVGSAVSHESSISFRVIAGGWPDRERIRTLAIHFRDVERNRQIRDDYARVMDASHAHFAIKGAPATAVSALLEAGLLDQEEWAVDPFGVEDDTPRHYAVAPVPADVDIRQAILLAYQAKPGLRGNHLAVLWNGHVVELTPAALANALVLAAEGKPLPPEGDWYKDALRPLYETTDPRTRPEPEWWDEGGVEVRVIDDQGNEILHEVDEDKDTMQEVEKILDKQK